MTGCQLADVGNCDRTKTSHSCTTEIRSGISNSRVTAALFFLVRTSIIGYSLTVRAAMSTHSMSALVQANRLMFPARFGRQFAGLKCIDPTWRDADILLGVMHKQPVKERTR